MAEEKIEKEEKETVKESVKRKLAKKDEEITKALADKEHWKNEYYRVYADMSNLRKDIEKDHREVIKYRIEGFVDKLLGVLDSFDLAFRFEATSEEMKKYLQGFKYVYNSLISILEEEGIQVITPQMDTKFDENTMQAVDTIETDGEENLVKNVNLIGYKLHDHLIRPAMVIVSKHPSEEAKEEEKVETIEEEKVA